MDIIGRSVKLRAWQEDDASRVAALLADARVVRNLDHWAHGPYTLHEARQWVQRDPGPGDRAWAIECLEDGALIGSTGLHHIDFQNRRAMWGIWIGPPDRWGRGYGTEACMLAVEHAFSDLGLEKVYLYVWSSNARGRRAYEKAGFSKEGTLRRHFWLEGQLVDVEAMAVFSDHPAYAERRAQDG